MREGQAEVRDFSWFMVLVHRGGDGVIQWLSCGVWFLSCPLWCEQPPSAMSSVDISERNNPNNPSSLNVTKYLPLWGGSGTKPLNIASLFFGTDLWVQFGNLGICVLEKT